jgi:predicted RNA-binding protein
MEVLSRQSHLIELTQVIPSDDVVMEDVETIETEGHKVRH